MNKYEAKKIAQAITNEQLLEMFKKAKSGIKNWEAASKVNKGFSKGLTWNILASDFDINKDYHLLAKINMIREYGEFLSADMKPERAQKYKPDSIQHRDPIFNF